MNYANIKYCDISNGPGVRTSLYVSGCTHHCLHCFNPMTWDFGYGEPFTEQIEEEILESLKPEYISGFSLLGGEPMEIENQRALLPFVTKIKEQFPQKTIWCYSGYTYEELVDKSNHRCNCEVTKPLLERFDVLVDGEFVQDLYDISLRFRGSLNQRLIDLARTRQQGKIICWEDPFGDTSKRGDIKCR